MNYMGNVIGQLLPFAVGVALSPVPVIAVILILFTGKARGNSFAFLSGWLLGLSAAGLIALALVDTAAGETDDPSTVSGVIKLVLGILFVLLAIHNWRSRPRDNEDAVIPKWMSALDGFSAIKSLGIAVLLSGVNPKNLALTVAASATIATAGLSGGREYVTLAIFVALASLTVATPVLVYLVMGEKADAGLTRLKEWLARNNNAVMAVLFLVFAAKLIGDGISIFSG